MTDPRYPIGPFEAQAAYSSHERASLIEVTRSVPDSLRAAVAGLSSTQLATPYREGGWRLESVVHHLPDAHANVLVRVQQALTDDAPTVNVFHEDLWEPLQTRQHVPLELSLTLFDAVQHRLALMFGALEADDWQRGFRHPQLGVQTPTTWCADARGDDGPVRLACAPSHRPDSEPAPAEGMVIQP